MARRGGLPVLALAVLVVCLLLVQPQPAAADDWFSKAVGTVSDFFKQNPNEQESYSAAKETAEEMQGVHRRRAQLGTESWQGAIAENYQRGALQAQKYWTSGRRFLSALVQGYAPRPVVDFISRMHAAPAAAADAARSAGHSAAEVVSGSTGSTFDDLHAQAQDGADALSRAAEAAKKKADDAVKDVKEAVNSEL